MERVGRDGRDPPPPSWTMVGSGGGVEGVQEDVDAIFLKLGTRYRPPGILARTKSTSCWDARVNLLGSWGSNVP